MARHLNRKNTLATVILIVILNGAGSSDSSIHVDLSLDLINVVRDSPVETGSGGQN